MVSFESIAIFILATTATNGKYKQDYATYLESRIIPIRETWGQYFPSLHFVFGTNKKDYDFLSQQCRQVESPRSKRQLKAKGEQMPSLDQIIHYKCPIYEIESYYHSSLRNNNSDVKLAAMQSSSLLYEFDALFTANCTGEYFGIGPTCRCQESMRYFNQDPSMKSAEWFVFMDDDIHYRPYALQTLLSGVTTSPNVSHSNKGVALVGSSRYRSFEFSKKQPPHSCRESVAYEFPFAQPAMINRAAMQYMSNGIRANGLTQLQAEWGGTHDALLGMLFWLYDVPTYSLNSSYVGGAFLMERGKIVLGKGKLKSDYTPHKQFMFHRVSNFKAYGWNNRDKKYFYKFAFAGQYDVANMLGDTALYASKQRAACRDSVNNCTDSTILTQHAAQVKEGLNGVANLYKFHGSNIHLTTFATQAKNMHQEMNTPNANRIHTFKKHPVHTASTGKKAAVANVSKWKRTHLNAVSPDEKQDIEAKVKAAMAARAKIGADVVVGFNSVMRLIQSDQAAVVCVAQDGHQAMLKVLVESTQVRAIPTVTIPKLNQSMRSVFGLRSASCFALKRMELEEEVPPTEVVEGADDEDDQKHHRYAKSATVDDLRDFLLSLQ